MLPSPLPPPVLLLEHLPDGICVITLNRAHVLNALSLELVDELHAAFDRLMSSSSSARVVILRAAGKSFCAGADITACWHGVGGRKWDASQLVNQKRFSGLIVKLRALPQPVIACVQGAAAGGGMCLALASDVILATRKAKFIASFANIGLTGCELGTSYFLPKAIGPHNASRYLLTGDALLGEEAFRLGMVQRLFDDGEAMFEHAVELANRMVTNLSPMGLELTKRQLNATADGMSLEVAIHTEDLNQLLCLNHGPTMQLSAEKIARFAKTTTTSKL